MIGLLAGSVLADGGPLRYASAATSESQQFLDDARERLKAGDPNAALIQLRNALQEDPQNWQARRLLGELYLAAGQLQSAEKEFGRFLEANPGHPEVSMLRAQTLLGMRDYDAALASLPDDVADPEVAYKAETMRAELLLALNRTGEATAVVDALRTERPQDARVAVLAARTALAGRDMAEAERLAIKATELDPELSPAWLFRAQIELAQQDLEQARAFAEKASELAPNNIRSTLMLAELDIRLGQLDEAEAKISGLLEQAPDAVQPLYLQAALFAARNDFEEADRVLARISEPLRQFAPAQFLTGLVKYRLGQYAQARSYLENYVAAQPDNLVAQRLLAATLLRSDSPGRAADVLTQAAAANPDDQAILRLLATAQMRAGDFSAATETLRKLASTPAGRDASQAQALVNLLDVESKDLDVDGQELANEVARILNDLQVGELDAAQQGAEALAERYPDNPVAQNTLAGVLLARGQDAEARTHLEKAIEADDRFYAAYENLNRLDVRAGDFDAIEQRLTAFLERYPNDAWGASRYAAFLTTRGRRGEAERVLEDAIAAHPDNRELLVAALTLDLQTENKEAILSSAERLAESLPDDVEAQLRAGRVMAELGELDRAAALFEKAGSLAGQGDGRALELLTQVRLRQGDQAGAEQAASELVKAQPANVAANRVLIDLFMEGGKQSAVDELLAGSAAIDSELHERLKAYIALRQDQPEEAATILEKITAPSAGTVEERFVARSRAGEPDKAKRLLAEWVAAHPTEAGPAMLLANQLIREQNYAQAETVLSDALPAARNNAVLLNNLAWLRSEAGADGAVQLARRAMSIAPNSPDIADTLGWILVKQGQTEEGLALLREAAEGAPNNPDIAYHLAFALNERGDKAGAEAILEEIMAGEQSFMHSAEADALLKKLQDMKKN